MDRITFLKKLKVDLDTVVYEDFKKRSYEAEKIYNKVKRQLYNMEKAYKNCLGLKGNTPSGQ